MVFAVKIIPCKLAPEIHYSIKKPKYPFMHFGKTLMLLRKLKNTTQKQLAQKIETTQQYVSELEQQNHFNRAKLDKILKALNSNKDEWEHIKKFPTSKN